MSIKSMFDAVMTGGSIFLGYDPLRKNGAQPSHQLLEAILTNNIHQVRKLLEQGLDPNTSLGIGPSDTLNGDPLSEDRILGIEKAFCWKKVFGDTPTLIHLSVLSVYYRKNRQRDLDRALKILDLLMEHGGDVSQHSINIFLRPAPEAVESNPLDFAMGVQRLELGKDLVGSTACAMTQAITIIRKEREKKRDIQTNNIPFEMIPLGLVDSTTDFMFQKNYHKDIRFMLGCGSGTNGRKEGLENGPLR
jgi:hypothetical protein